jgi:8-amino-7-oxononanoate synthase
MYDSLLFDCVGNGSWQSNCFLSVESLCCAKGEGGKINLFSLPPSSFPLCMPHNPLDWIDDELATLAERQLRRNLLMRSSAQLPARIEISGREYVNFGSNDYLGLAAEPAVRSAAQAAIDEIGFGAGASPLVTGRGSYHAQLEQQLATFEGTEAALLFPTGYAANIGTITALVGPGDVVFSDAKNHASIIDGCRLSGARIVIYPHNDLAALQSLLREGTSFRRRLIATDSHFSMDGDYARLDQLAQLAEDHDCMLMADEAHATGVVGQRGRGVTELQNVHDGVPIRVGTLSKALGSHGGFVVGSRRLMEWLVNRARPYIFSTAAPEAAAAAALAALQLVESEPHRRQELLQLADSFREQLREAGFRVGTSESQIVPIILGDPERTLRAAEQLREQGFFVPAIRPPSVPQGESLLRISLCWGHGEAMIHELLHKLVGMQSGYRLDSHGTNEPRAS